MERIKGTTKPPIVERIGKTYYVRWSYKTENEEITYNQIEFPYKPTLDIIKDIILGIENSKIDKEILSGFVWKDMPVWLSSENQFNYKAAYDLAVMLGGANLPVTFKFGDTENPVYHTFESIDDISDFYMKAMNHVNQTLLSGWTEKDSISWDDYKTALEAL